MAEATELVALQETLYQSSNPTRRWLHCTRRDWVVRAIERNRSCDPSSRALEIGPGSGVYLRTLGRCFGYVVASDVEDAYLEVARRLQTEFPTLSCQKDDITATKLPPKSFDLILCTEVLEHIRESQSALIAMHRLLKPKGLLVLSTPQRYSPLELAGHVAFLPGVIHLLRRIYKEPILATGHINLMTEQTVRTQLKNAGFTVTETHKSGVYFPLIAEFGGELGLNFEQWLEAILRDGPLDWLLWTQYYLAQS